MSCEISPTVTRPMDSQEVVAVESVQSAFSGRGTSVPIVLCVARET